MMKRLTSALVAVIAPTHDPKASARWECPCWMCKLANPDKLTRADAEAKLSGRGRCHLPTGMVIRQCNRARGHQGRCLP